MDKATVTSGIMNLIDAQGRPVLYGVDYSDAATFRIVSVVTPIPGAEPTLRVQFAGSAVTVERFAHRLFTGWQWVADPDTLAEMRDEESMARIAPLDEDEPACVAVVGKEAVRAVADRMRVRAYLVKAADNRLLTGKFRPTIKGFNSDYGTSCRSWADVATEARKMLG